MLTERNLPSLYWNFIKSNFYSNSQSSWNESVTYCRRVTCKVHTAAKISTEVSSTTNLITDSASVIGNCCPVIISTAETNTHTHTHTHTFNGHLSGTTRVSRYQKGETNLDFTEARDSEWQWHRLGHMQVCTSLQTDNHTSTPLLSFFTGRMPFLPPNQQCQSTEGVHSRN